VSANRSQRRLGILIAVTQQRGAHTLKAGMEGAQLALRERFQFAVVDPAQGAEAGLSAATLGYTFERPFDFQARARRPQYSLYAQDSWRAASRMTFEFGVRFDHTRLLLDEHALDPRLGASYRFGNGSTVLRASLNRFYQPAQPEYLLLASSTRARTLSPFAQNGGGADVPAERQTALEAAAEQKLGPVHLDVAVWQRRIRNQADPNVLFGTNIVFPNSVARGRAEGLDVRVELPRRRRWSGYVTYTLSRVVQFGPINGGVFLQDDFLDIGPGVRFTPDHDQRHVASAAATYRDERRGWVATIAARYESGTPVEVPEEALVNLASRPGSDLVDVEAGRVRPHLVIDAIVTVRMKRWQKADLSAHGAVLNVMDERYAFNFGNPFSGTHFGAPRSVSVGLSVARP
jgi:outer membrane receptor protein involved in Fe transport